MYFVFSFLQYVISWSVPAVTFCVVNRKCNVTFVQHFQSILAMDRQFVNFLCYFLFFFSSSNVAKEKKYRIICNDG